jgi:DNA ligase 1
MSIITKPLLASNAEENKLVFPLLATPKIDGIRCLLIDGQAKSRKFKLIPNVHIRTQLEALLPAGADGEIISGSTFQSTSSAVMSVEGEPTYTYCWFDWVFDTLDTPYKTRMFEAKKYYAKHLKNTPIRLIYPRLIETQEALLKYEAECLADGYEGVMLRDPLGPYKCGISGVKEGILLKLKRFMDSEARIIGFEEMMHNENEAELDELGHTKRSTAKDGKVPANTLGKFLVEDLKTQQVFEIGTGQGLTMELRKKIWDNKEDYLPLIIKYKYQAQGVKDLPRFPVMIGFRHPDDMGE